MKKTLLTLLGSAAIFVAAGAANAADVPVPEPTPEVGNYVQVCDAFGAGYFYIPGTETCLKASGAVSFSAGYDSFSEDRFGGADASVSFETKADSELGTIGTKVTLASKANFDAYYLGLSPERTNEVTEAYLTVGPAWVGYKDTLFNTDVLYGDFNLNDRLNSTSIGFMQTGIANGVYAGLALENYRRGEGFLNENTTYDKDIMPDVVARVGIEQAWGVADLSAAYSDFNDAWVVKATADIKASDAIEFRVAGAYGESDDLLGTGLDINAEAYVLSAAGKYNYSNMFSVFAGGAVADVKDVGKAWFANGGVIVTPATNLDLVGQVTYTDAGDDNWNTKLTVKRSF